MANFKYMGSPGDFNKIGSLQQLQEMPNFLKTRAFFYDVQQFQFPLTPAEFDGSFGGTIKLFSTIPNQPCPGRQTNMLAGTTVPEPFLLTSIQIVAYGETKKFSMPGQFVDRAAVAGTCPAVGPCAEPEPGIDCGVGCAPTASDVSQDATLYWGGAIDQFIVNFMQAYRLELALGRYLLLDEANFDIGMKPPPCFEGASDSLVPAQGYIREVNDILAGKGCSRMFLPQNVAAGSLCVGAPTAGATYGCVTVGGTRPFCLNYPLLLLPQLPLNIQWTRVENDCCFFPAMRRNSVVDCGAGPTTADGSLPAGCNASWTIPGGCLSLGLNLGGFILTPQCCLSYINQFAVAGSLFENLYVGNPYLGGIINNPAIRSNLAGVPDQSALNRFLGAPKI